MHYQAIIIGGGPAGYVCALRLRQNNITTLLIEKDNIGGTCLNKGCIPTKAMLHIAHLYSDILNSDKLGISVGNVELQMDKAYSYRDDTVSRLRKGVLQLLSGRGVDIVSGSATLKSTNSVIVNEQEFSGDNIILAVGSEVSMPNIKGIEHCVNSDYFLQGNHALPKSIAIVGGGVIGVEYATMLSSFGVQVSVIEYLDRILSMADKDITTHLTLHLKKKGVKFVTKAKVEAVETSSCGYIISYTDTTGDKQLNVDMVLVCTGRKANTAGLNLSEIGVATDDRGNILVDNFKTSVGNIYAIGDCVGGIQLAHFASAQATALADILSNKNSEINMNVVPSCVYTTPEIAWVGLNEQQCIERSLDVTIGKFPLGACAKAVISGLDKGFVKTIFEKDSGILVGASIFGDRATDMIGELALAITKKLTNKDISHTIHPHPTMVESIAESAEISLNRPLHIL